MYYRDKALILKLMLRNIAKSTFRSFFKKFKCARAGQKEMDFVLAIIVILDHLRIRCWAERVNAAP